MPNIRLINVNANSGAFVTINASIPVRRMEVIEDEGTVPQGLDFQVYTDSFATTYDVEAATEPIVLGSVVGNFKDNGSIIGLPQQPKANSASTDFNFIAATPLIKVRSKTALATKVRVTEFE